MYFRIIIALTLFCSFIGQLQTTARQPQSSTENFDGWLLTSEKIEEAARPYLGNGFQGVRFSWDGTNWSGDHDHFVAGVYYSDDSQSPAYTERICPTPNWTKIGLHNGDRYLEKGSGQVFNYKQIQNLKQGTLTTSFTWRDGDKSIDVEVIAFMSKVLPSLGVVRYKITPKFSGPVHFNCVLDGSDLKHQTALGPAEPKLIEIAKEVTRRNQRFSLHSKTSLGIELGNAVCTQISNAKDAIQAYSQKENRLEQRTNFNAEANQTYTFDV